MKAANSFLFMRPAKLLHLNTAKGFPSRRTPTKVYPLVTSGLADHNSVCLWRDPESAVSTSEHDDGSQQTSETAVFHSEIFIASEVLHNMCKSPLDEKFH